MGDYLKEKLENLKNTCSFIKEVRGKGLMIGVDVHPVRSPSDKTSEGSPNVISGLTSNGAKEILKKCMDKGLLIGTADENVLRFLPPLVIQKKDIDEGITILDEVLSNLR